ncbi:MAG: ATP-binding protein [Deltaproteobacteria bacterium]|nr:ATP-binding protein [Deltaproteobacteria bacterium]
MDVNEKNRLLSLGKLDEPGLFPRLEELRAKPFAFKPEFGLAAVPEEPGVIVIRGPRQYGKSTWLEGAARETVQRFGPGTAFLVNGDDLRDADALADAIRSLVPLFRTQASVRRIFVDEITAVDGWQKGLKRVIDEGLLRAVLCVTTGSKATDLRRGIERLPGRTGRLARTNYLFTPVPYKEFIRVCGNAVGESATSAYLLSGGCPAAMGEIAVHGRLPEFVPVMIRDWVGGEFAGSGRSRQSLVAVVRALLLRGGAPVGQAKLAREAGLANNTVAAGYVELLADLMCVATSLAWDASRSVPVHRKPAKYHVTNLLFATSWDPERPRTAGDFLSFDPGKQGVWLEWLVAQELWRRAAVHGNETPEVMAHWEGGGHEIDFVLGRNAFLEVMRGPASPHDFAWFPQVFPKAALTVVNKERFDAGPMRGITFEDFLLDESLHSRL